MVNYLGYLSGVILLFSVTIHSVASVGYFSTSGITWGCASGVDSLIAPIFIFDVCIFLGAPIETLLGCIFYWVFYWVRLLNLFWVPQILAPLEVMHGLLDAFL